MLSSEKKASNNEVGFMAINKSTTKSDLWIRDTRASTHMKNTTEGLFDLKKEKTIVKIGNGERLK